MKKLELGVGDSRYEVDATYYGTAEPLTFCMLMWRICQLYTSSSTLCFTVRNTAVEYVQPGKRHTIKIRDPVI